MRRTLEGIAGVAIALAVAALAAAPAAATPAAATSVASGSPASGAAAASAAATDEVVVGYEDGTTALHRLPASISPRRAAIALERSPGIEYAHPNWIARSAGGRYVPNDPGTVGRPRGWRRDQWNFASRYGVRAPKAWQRLIRVGRAGGAGTVVAIVDTGVAHSSAKPGFQMSPDFTTGQFTPGHDFVDGDDMPLDMDGHGTHIAGTIGEQVDNGVALTGLAYGAKIMPVRVLDESGMGTAAAVAAGIRFAARNKADVVNLSLEFPRRVRRCRQVRVVCEAIEEATAAGALVVAAAGNRNSGRVAMPARAPDALAIGGTTDRGCLGEYSSHGRGLALVAPGGGRSDPLPHSGCRRSRSGEKVLQLSFDEPDYDRFEIRGLDGTSMAAAHVAAAAALVEASGAVGKDPSPAKVRRQLKRTARKIGPHRLYGAGLLNAARATRRR